jgi:hypothetical protein
MKLEVGMYVRTTNSYIYKLSCYEEDENRWISSGESDWYPVYESNVVKASYNIIDLIEVGDIITLGENNYPLQIRNKWEHGGDIHVELSNGAKFEDLHYNNEFKIYSIVTKEQFESMSYKVDE